MLTNVLISRVATMLNAPITLVVSAVVAKKDIQAKVITVSILTSVKSVVIIVQQTLTAITPMDHLNVNVRLDLQAMV